LVNCREAAEGRFLRADNVKASANKIGVIISEGEYTDGKFGRKLEVKIQFNKINKIWSLNQVSATNLMDAYGEECNEWVGKKVEFEIEESNGKEVIVGYPAEPKTTVEKV
jgi:hypothetical protein